MTPPPPPDSLPDDPHPRPVELPNSRPEPGPFRSPVPTGPRSNFSSREAWREHRRRRFRRRGRRAYIQSVYFLPSMATLGNAVCGFAAMYVAALTVADAPLPGMVAAGSVDAVTAFFSRHHFVVAAYLIFFAMIFDALDGRLARLTRHTTDFGGQLDSLADVISFGAAPAFLALQLLRSTIAHDLPDMVTRAIWAIGAIYMSCAAMRLARFNVSNEHGEQHHFSFLGLPSPGAGACVAGFVLMQQWLSHGRANWVDFAQDRLPYALPFIVLGSGLLMVSSIRYPHVVNRYMRGKKSIAKLVLVLALLLLLVVAHELTIGLGTLLYVLWGIASYLSAKAKFPAKATPSA